MTTEQHEADMKKARYEWSKVADERDALKVVLEEIGGLLDYWGNEGGWHDEHAIKCFRAVGEVLRRALDQLEEKK